MTRRLLATALLIAASASVSAAFTLRFEMPKGWVPKAPSSSMRVAEFVLPKADGDAEDATLTVYSFPGGGGTVEANLERWIGQMSQPDGKPSKEVAKTSTMTSTSGVKMTLVDVPGTYIAEVSPGSTERFNKPGFRLRLHQKDLANAMTTAKEASIPLPVAALLQQIVTALVENGNGELDHAAIARFVEDMAHTRIHGS